MEKDKLSNSYYLDSDNINWVAAKAKDKERSASWYLNELITRLRNKRGI